MLSGGCQDDSFSFGMTSMATRMILFRLEWLRWFLGRFFFVWNDLDGDQDDSFSFRMTSVATGTILFSLDVVW
jgi:hypothetical protein